MVDQKSCLEAVKFFLILKVDRKRADIVMATVQCLLTKYDLII